MITPRLFFLYLHFSLSVLSSFRSRGYLLRIEIWSKTVCVRGLRNAFSLYDGYFKYAACTTSCYTGRLADTWSRKKKGKRESNCSGVCNTYNAVSIITLVLTLNRLFGKLRNRFECRRTGKNADNFIYNWYTILIGYM